MSADGRYAITIIAFVGSVFSPRYAAARRRSARADPENHCALNVALYGPGVERWAFTEFAAQKISRSADHFELGHNRLSWSADGELEVQFADKTAVFGSKLEGRAILRPNPGPFSHHVELDEAGRHHWCGIAPRASIEVEVEQPGLRFTGSGYHDANWGSEPLEDGFSSWTWSRTDVGDKTQVLYDVNPRVGSAMQRGLEFGADGSVRDFLAPSEIALPSSGWRLPGVTRVPSGAQVELRRRLEDTPFYSRSLLDVQGGGRGSIAVHEHLDLDRFKRRVVQLMLRTRMRRG